MLLLQNFVFAQNQDLVTLAKGNYMGFNAVFDQKDNLYGYVALYGYGKSEEKTKKFEYVILDKNLNPFVSKEFDGDITAADYYSCLNNEGDLCFVPNEIDYGSLKKKDFFIPRVLKVDLKDFSVNFVKDFYYDGQNILETKLSKSIEEYNDQSSFSKKEKEYKYSSKLYELKHNDFLVNETKVLNKTKTTIGNAIYFDKDQKEVWRYEYRNDNEAIIINNLQILSSDEKYIFASYLEHKRFSKKGDLIIFDKANGKILKSIPLQDILPDDGAYSISYDPSVYFIKVRSINNKLYIFKDFNNRGYARIEIDKENLDVVGKFFKYKEDLSKYIPKIDKDGGVEGKYSLRYHESFILNDGSMGIVLEKFKPDTGIAVSSGTTDLVLVRTDPDFKVQDVMVFDKEKTKHQHGDYLFSQLLNDKKDVVFYFRDLVGKGNNKNWNLFINTIINGEFKQEVVPISSEKHMSFPYIAKEGYILLQEFNKKEKYNKIRLERLNY